MSLKFISRYLLLISFLFIFSCQDRLPYFETDKNKSLSNNKIIKEKSEKLDFKNYELLVNDEIDYYSNEFVNYNFTKKKLKRIKVNNYENTIANNLSINTYFINSEIFSINYKGEIVNFEKENGKLITKFPIEISSKNINPVSFTLIDNDFIVGFRSGEILRVKKNGEIKWSYKDNNILNTPIKLHNNKLVVLYPNSIVILSSDNGDIIYKKEYNTSNIIQSNGGKLVSYFNLLFFILANSEFKVLDTYLNLEHFSRLEELQVNTPLNNLSDKIYVYENLFVYLDNGNSLSTYNILSNNYLLENYKISNFSSLIFFNNSFITKNESFLQFFNIKNGNLFASIDIKKYLKINSELIKAITINEKLHLFSSDGKLIIINQDFDIEDAIDLKIKNIIRVYNYQDKFFISTSKGLTYIF